MSKYDALIELIALRKKQIGISTEELACKSGCTKKAMYSYLSKDRKMPVDVLLNCLEAVERPIRIETYRRISKDTRVII